MEPSTLQSLHFSGLIRKIEIPSRSFFPSRTSCLRRTIPRLMTPMHSSSTVITQTWVLQLSLLSHFWLPLSSTAGSACEHEPGILYHSSLEVSVCKMHTKSNILAKAHIL